MPYQYQQLFFVFNHYQGVEGHIKIIYQSTNDSLKLSEAPEIEQNWLTLQSISCYALTSRYVSSSTSMMMNFIIVHCSVSGQLHHHEAPAWSPNGAVALEEELRSEQIITSMVRQLFGSPTSEWSAATDRFGRK